MITTGHLIGYISNKAVLNVFYLAFVLEASVATTLFERLLARLESSLMSIDRPFNGIYLS